MKILWYFLFFSFKWGLEAHHTSSSKRLFFDQIYLEIGLDSIYDDILS